MLCDVRLRPRLQRRVVAANPVCGHTPAVAIELLWPRPCRKCMAGIDKKSRVQIKRACTWDGDLRSASPRCRMAEPLILNPPIRHSRDSHHRRSRHTRWRGRAAIRLPPCWCASAPNTLSPGSRARRRPDGLREIRWMMGRQSWIRWSPPGNCRHQTAGSPFRSRLATRSAIHLSQTWAAISAAVLGEQGIGGVHSVTRARRHAMRRR